MKAGWFQAHSNGPVGLISRALEHFHQHHRVWRGAHHRYSPQGWHALPWPCNGTFHDDGRRISRLRFLPQTSCYSWAFAVGVAVGVTCIKLSCQPPHAMFCPPRWICASSLMWSRTLHIQRTAHMHMLLSKIETASHLAVASQYLMYRGSM